MMGGLPRWASASAPVTRVRWDGRCAPGCEFRVLPDGPIARRRLVQHRIGCEAFAEYLAEVVPVEPWVAGL